MRERGGCIQPQGRGGHGKGKDVMLRREKLIIFWTQAKHYARKTSADEICITGGASQSLANILLSFTDPGVTRAGKLYSRVDVREGNDEG